MTAGSQGETPPGLPAKNRELTERYAMAIFSGDIFVVKHITSSFPATQNLSVAINTVHYVAGVTVGTGSTEQEFANNRALSASIPYKAFFNATTQFDGVIVQKVFPLPIGVEFLSIFGNGPGIRLTDQLPMQTCGIITKFTALAGRKFRGRNYIPYPLEDDNGGDQKPTAAYLALLSNWAQAAYTPFTSGVGGNTTDWASVIYHGATGVPTFSIIASFQGRNYWATQRRRMNAFKADTRPI